MSKNTATASNAVISVVAASPETIAAENQMNRKVELKRSDIKACNSSDYQLAARSILPKPLYEYLASGTDDEQTLSENVSLEENISYHQ